MNKKYLKDNNLLEAHKQFMRLCEYSSVNTSYEVDEPEEDPNGGGDPSMGGGADSSMGGGMPGGGGDPSMGGGMPGGGDPSMGGGADSSMDGGMPGGGDPSMGGGADPLMGGDAMPEEPEEEDDVIDVDDLTDAQEKLNKKTNAVGHEVQSVEGQISNLLKALEKMQSMVDSNNQKIADFQREFEKRNPSETEKLNLRSLDSYPYNVSVKDFWDSKNSDPNSNYSAYSNNDESTTQEWKVTNSDVDDFNERDIANSFGMTDDLNQTLEKIFNL